MRKGHFFQHQEGNIKDYTPFFFFFDKILYNPEKYELIHPVFFFLKIFTSDEVTVDQPRMRTRLHSMAVI